MNLEQQVAELEAGPVQPQKTADEMFIEASKSLGLTAETVKLTQKDMECIARHIACFIEDSLYYERAADFGRPCLDCTSAHQGKCTNSPQTFDAWPTFEKLSKLSGVEIRSIFPAKRECLER